MYKFIAILTTTLTHPLKDKWKPNEWLQPAAGVFDTKYAAKHCVDDNEYWEVVLIRRIKI